MSDLARKALNLMETYGIRYSLRKPKDEIVGTNFYLLNVFDPSDLWSIEHINYIKDKYDLNFGGKYYHGQDAEIIEIKDRKYFLKDLLYGGESMFNANLDSILYWFLINNKNEALRNFAQNNFGAPKETSVGLEFVVYRGSCAPSYDGPSPPFYKKKKWYPKLELLNAGIIVDIEGHNYKVSWPGFADLEEAPWSHPENCSKFIMTPTNEPLTESSNSGEFYIWGDNAYYQQTPMYPMLNGKAAYQFMHIPDFRRQDFTCNLALAIESGKPARLYFDGSST